MSAREPSVSNLIAAQRLLRDVVLVDLDDRIADLKATLASAEGRLAFWESHVERTARLLAIIESAQEGMPT